MSSEVKAHPALAPLSWLFGTWHSTEAVVSYPSMDPLEYKERLEILPTEQPALDYKSDTWKNNPSKTKMHCERGFLKIDVESGKLILILAHNFGLTEISEGTFENQELTLESDTLSGTSCTKLPATKKLIRKLKRDGDYLYSTILMESVNHKLQKHLECKYVKEDI